MTSQTGSSTQGEWGRGVLDSSGSGGGAAAPECRAATAPTGSQAGDKSVGGIPRKRWRDRGSDAGPETHPISGSVPSKKPHKEDAPGCTTGLPFFSSDTAAPSFPFAADGIGMKVLAKDLEAKTPNLLGLIKDWESHRQGSRHWFWVPGEGIIKTVKGARLYLAALYAHRNSACASEGERPGKTGLTSGLAGLRVPEGRRKLRIYYPEPPASSSSSSSLRLH